MMKGVVGGALIVVGLLMGGIGALALTGPAKIAMLLIGILLALAGVIYLLIPSSGVDATGKVGEVKLTQEGTGRVSQVVVGSSGSATIPKAIYTVNPVYNGVVSWDRGLLEELTDRVQAEMEKKAPSGYNDCGAATSAYEEAKRKVEAAKISETPNLRGITEILVRNKIKLSCQTTK